MNGFYRLNSTCQCCDILLRPKITCSISEGSISIVRVRVGLGWVRVNVCGSITSMSVAISHIIIRNIIVPEFETVVAMQNDLCT